MIEVKCISSFGDAAGQWPTKLPPVFALGHHVVSSTGLKLQLKTIVWVQLKDTSFPNWTPVIYLE